MRRDGQPETWLARGGALLVPASDLQLVGRHNALNALAALALASAVAKIDHSLLAALARFAGLPHRMQKIADAGGVLFVDDSKGTTVAATRAALAGLSRPVVLIAGGDGKGQDFSPLKAAVDEHCRAVLLIGRDAPVIERALAGTAAVVECPGTLDLAVTRAIAAGEARRRRRALAGVREPRPVRQLRRARRALPPPRAGAAGRGCPCVRAPRRRARCGRSAC